MKYFFTYIGLLLSLIVLISSAVGKSDKKIMTEANLADSTRTIDNAESAVGRAVRYIGLDSVDGYKITKSPGEMAKAVIMKDSTTAFLADSISGRAAWRIEFDAVPVGERKAQIETFLDSCTSLPLRIVFRFEDVGYREPTAKEAKTLLGAFTERYFEISTLAPEIPAMQTFEKCDHYAQFAKEIIISYVLYAQDHYSKSLPAWIVYFRGIPPVSSKEYVPLHMRTNMRYVFNAQSGVGLFRNNMPYPILNDN